MPPDATPPIDSPIPAAGTEHVPNVPLDAQTLGVSLTVRDLQASLVWYRDVVGFTVDREYEREGKRIAVALRAGAVRLLISQDNGAKGLDRAKGEGFSLQLTTAQNIDAIARRIKARGGTLDSEPADIWGARAFRLRDPDGFRLAISSPRAG
jgi:uncharacterized glyoxalase superfamily protein PhnB